MNDTPEVIMSALIDERAAFEGNQMEHESKRRLSPWTAEDELRLTAILEAWDASKGPKKLLWKDAAKQLGSNRTARSIREHWKYMQQRQQRVNATLAIRPPPAPWACKAVTVCMHQLVVKQAAADAKVATVVAECINRLVAKVEHQAAKAAAAEAKMAAAAAKAAAAKAKTAAAEAKVRETLASKAAAKRAEAAAAEAKAKQRLFARAQGKLISKAIKRVVSGAVAAVKARYPRRCEHADYLEHSRRQAPNEVDVNAELRRRIHAARQFHRRPEAERVKMVLSANDALQCASAEGLPL